MILKMPEYYKKFRCIADKCRDSCCIGWEIGIDSSTAEFYRSIQGDFVNRLRENISPENSFILSENERCPFLNDRNLCDIYINLGEENLCGICTEHPRFYEWFGNIKEGGIGLSCEAAAKIILTENEKFRTFEAEISEEADDDFDTENSEIFRLLCDARKLVIRHLQYREIPLNQRISDVLSFCDELQDNIDSENFQIPEMSSTGAEFHPDLAEILNFMLDFETMEENRTEYLTHQIESIQQTESAELPPETSLYLENTAIYFVWRYFLKGAFDGYILPYIRIAAVSTAVIGNMFALKLADSGNLTEDDCVILAKTYSKEIEYSEENIASLADFLG